MALEADLYVIQECEDPSVSSDVEFRTWCKNYLWVGENKRKGLGVFARDDLLLEKCELDPGEFELFLPCRVAERLALLAVWTRISISPSFGYIGQLGMYLRRHKDFFEQDNLLIMGDLNSNAQWDRLNRRWNHTGVVGELEQIGLKSAYHYVQQEKHGQESTPTFFMHRHREKPYHIDYAFVSDSMLQEVSLVIERPDPWLEFSDHMPVILNIANLGD